MTTTLVLTDRIAAEILAAIQLGVESAGVLLARAVETPEGRRLLGRRIFWVPDGAYARREHDSLSIRSEGYVPALAEAEAMTAVPIWLHTHPSPGASPRPSRHDDRVDGQLSDLFRLRAGSEHYGSVIFSSQNDRLNFAGHLESGQVSIEIDRLWVVGRRLFLGRSAIQDANPLSTIFDRNIRAFGGEIQQVLGDLTIAIVGCGGTGSSIAEQLVRLGVRNMTLIDPDHLSDSNLTRVYGSQQVDVGRKKVDVLGDHLQHIVPDVRVDRIASMVTVERSARRLVDADVVFGCTDDNAGRLVLSRLATFMLIPVIDCGVLLTSGVNGALDGIYGRVTVLTPGAACLVCRNRIDLARASAELLTPGERVRRQDEGYAPALGAVEPAVVSFTTLISASAVTELLDRLVHFGPEPAPSETLIRVHDREISTNDPEPRNRHYCDPASGKLGLGVTEPFLEQTWAA